MEFEKKANFIENSNSPLTYYPPCKSYGCNRNLSSSNPASQYQRLKIIQNTVRVPSSLYTMNLGALNVYQKPLPRYNVNWNQMSDRRVRSHQPTLVTGGSTYHGSSTRHTITRNRPGAGCPGGYGVDIKHNSYDRYLNRIKGKGPVRRGPIPPGFGLPIVNPFVQGGKTMKTSIVSNCNCPIATDGDGLEKEREQKLYSVLVTPIIFNSKYTFNVGDYVYTKFREKNLPYFYKALIQEINNEIYTIVFEDGTIGYRLSSELLIYFPCNCSSSTFNNSDISVNKIINFSTIAEDCILINNYAGGAAYDALVRRILNIQYE